MRNIFAPWRKTYIGETRNKERGCFICTAVNSDDDEKNLVVLRGQYAIVIVNKYPYNSGHVMVCPKRHIKFPYELNQEEKLEIMDFIGRMVSTLEKVYTPQGFNLGANIGRYAGAGEEHLHFHIVPRWSGDTNFISVIGDTRVIPETVEDTYKKLKDALKEG